MWGFSVTDSWIVIAAFLVFLMQAGFLLIEAGEVRAKNSISVAQKNISDMLISVAAYAVGGFGIMYGLSLGGFFGLGGVKEALTQSGSLPQILIFNLAFCSVVATIVSGAIAERMQILGYFVSTAIIAMLVYPILVIGFGAIRLLALICPCWVILDLSTMLAALQSILWARPML